MPAPIAYAALLRGVNLGPANKIAMADLARLCEKQRFGAVKTYIASGNVVFTCSDPEAVVKATLEKAIASHMGKPIPVMVRTAKELAAAVAANPFPAVEPKKLLVVFFDQPLTKAAIADAVTPDGEELAIKGRELYIHFPIGQGLSKIKLAKAASTGTGRNLNTVVKLAAMTAALG